jgi:GDPmannose 4,6-dehydratase
MKRALITGITGQDGSYLAEFLLSKGYEIHGIIRRASTFNTSRIDHIYVDPHTPGARLLLHYGDLSDSEQLSNILYNVKPDEVYHLGAQSHVRVSFDIPEYTANIAGLSATRILELLRRSSGPTKYYQASSSEMFGNASAPQNENTPLNPRSPYACSKAYAHWSAKNYREGYGLFVSCGILFNHESPRRGENFVTRKIARAVAQIVAKKEEKLYLGNLDPERDWGYAPEYVEAMWRMLQQDRPEDYVIGTGEAHSVKEFAEHAFNYVGLEADNYLLTDKRYFRPTEVNLLVADASKARQQLGWKPSVRFDELVRIMVDAELRRIGREPPGEGDEAVKKRFPQRWWKVD